MSWTKLVAGRSQCSQFEKSSFDLICFPASPPMLRNSFFCQPGDELAFPWRLSRWPLVHLACERRGARLTCMESTKRTARVTKRRDVRVHGELWHTSGVLLR